MTTYEIALPNQDPCFNFDTVLDNSTYYFRMRFNSRLNLWFLDLKDRKRIEILENDKKDQADYLYSNRIYDYI